MLNRQGGGDITWECNGCDALLETNTSHFRAALFILKRERWWAVQDGSKWYHYCGACKGRVQQEQEDKCEEGQWA